MRFWWVNQNKTFRHEIAGNYLWSPKRKNDGHRNPYYEFMREVSPGDIVFSFFDTRIAALGIAGSYCYESPKPTEFAAAGTAWGDAGWKVNVHFRQLENRIRPKDYIGELKEFLPEKYAPLGASGNGSQSIYLTEVSAAFATILFRLIGREADQTANVSRASAPADMDVATIEPSLEEWERRVEVSIRENRGLPETQRTALVQARRGQGIFRGNVESIERACRVTQVDRREHLIAGHIKPWRDGTNEERLDGENGFLLTPTIDHLFDKGFISFENNGGLIVSPVADPTSMRRMGLAEDINVGVFSGGQRRYLDYHRDNVLRMARRQAFRVPKKKRSVRS